MFKIEYALALAFLTIAMADARCPYTDNDDTPASSYAVAAEPAVTSEETTEAADETAPAKKVAPAPAEEVTEEEVIEEQTPAA